MNQKLKELKKRIELIELRNKKVELDKEWETSNFRKIIIVVVTYIAIGLYMDWMRVDNHWLNAIVPVVGFIFSTMTFNLVKDIWKNKKVEISKMEGLFSRANYKKNFLQ